MADFPSLPLWTSDYLADTQDLSAEEHGVYLLLLMAAWRSADCTLPDDDQRLARMAKVGTKKWRKMRPVMERFFTIGDGVIWQKRLVEERKRVENQRAQKREAANARWSTGESKNRSLCDADGKATSKHQKRTNGSDKPPNINDSGDADASSPAMRQTSPPSPSPDIYSPPPVTGAAGAGAGGGGGSDESDEQSQVRQVCDRIQRIVNAGHPLADLARYVRRWRDHGLDAERDIVPTVEAEMERRRQRGEGPPGHPKYFDKPVFRAFNERTAPPPANQSGAQPADVDDRDDRERKQWQARMAAHRDRGMWVDTWGPPPGKRGCKVPADVLSEFGYGKRVKEASG